MTLFCSFLWPHHSFFFFLHQNSTKIVVYTTDSNFSPPILLYPFQSNFRACTVANISFPGVLQIQISVLNEYLTWLSRSTWKSESNPLFWFTNFVCLPEDHVSWFSSYLTSHSFSVLFPWGIQFVYIDFNKICIIMAWNLYIQIFQLTALFWCLQYTLHSPKLIFPHETSNHGLPHLCWGQQYSSISSAKG